MSKKGSSLKYFSEDSARLTIQPKTVLIVSLIFIGLVVLLHIFSKVGADSPVQPTQPNTAQGTEQTQQQAEVHTEDTL